MGSKPNVVNFHLILIFMGVEKMQIRTRRGTSLGNILMFTCSLTDYTSFLQTFPVAPLQCLQHFK